MIILIVLGHANFPLRDFVYLFHVAAFFFISGFLFKDSHINQPVNFVIKRIKSLYIPFVLYIFIFVALHNVFVKWGILRLHVGTSSGGNYLYNVHDYVNVIKQAITLGNSEQLLVPMWFITVLFTVSMVFYFIKFIASKYLKQYANETVYATVVASFIVGSMLSLQHILLPRLANTSFVALGVYFLGYLFRRVEHQIPFRALYALLAVMFLAVNSHYGTIEMVTNRFPDPSFFLLSSLLGTYVVLYISKKFSQSSNLFDRFFQLVGQNSLHILALHLLAFKLATYVIIRLYGYPISRLAEFPIIEQPHMWILYSAFGLLIPLGFIYALKQGIIVAKRTYEGTRLSKGHQ